MRPCLRRIALLTTDFGLYHDLVRYLREPPDRTGVILTSWRDAMRRDLPEGIPVVAVPLDDQGNEDLVHGVLHAQRILEGIQGYTEVVVGIDPGKRPGIALLADGRLLHTAQLFSLEDVVPLGKRLIEQFPADRYLFRLGHGAPRERDILLERLRGLNHPDMRIELVDETGTTPPPGPRRVFSRDIAAALEIARTPGYPPARSERHVTSGAIRDVQRESRIQSGGRLTLSRDEARRVARGDMSLAEALDEASAAKRSRSRSSCR
jgi:hypothetical protein